jgi:HlyD family secretion protein
MTDHSSDATKSTSAPRGKQTPANVAPPTLGVRRIPHLRIALAVGVALVALFMVIRLGEGSDVPALVVRAEPFAASLAARGRLEASVIATVAAEAPGRVDAVLVHVGDSVAAGDPLLRLDAAVAREQYRAATALAASATEGGRSARAELAGAQVQRAERRADYERIAPLAGGAVSAADVAAAKAALDKAETDLERAAARLAQAESQAVAAVADREVAQRALNELVLRAPIAGIVVARDADPGNSVGAGTPLLRLADPSSLEVVAYVDETMLGGVRVGLPARVAFLSKAAETSTGNVRAVGREVDSETREVELWIALQQPPARWAIGQRVDVRVDTEPGATGTTVPTEMISWEEDKAGVFVVDAGRARRVPVELGRADRARVVVTGDVGSGDTILAPAGLRSGARVVPILVGAREGQ